MAGVAGQAEGGQVLGQAGGQDVQELLQVRVPGQQRQRAPVELVEDCVGDHAGRQQALAACEKLVLAEKLAFLEA